MKQIASSLILAAISCQALADFNPPVIVKTNDGKPISVESPGFAAPCLADVDGDGKPDLLVGQFNDGKIAFYKGEGNMSFQPRVWLKAEGEVAQVPGIW